MTQRIPLDHLTSDQLDALYDRLEHAVAHAADLDAADSEAAAAGSYAARAEQAEATIARVRALCDRYQTWHEGGWAPADAALVAREYRAALDQAQQPTTDEVRKGPTSLLTTIEPPVTCPHCGPEAAPVPATHWTKHLLRHHCECGGTVPHPECVVHAKSEQPAT